MRFEPVRIGVVGLGNFGRLHAITLIGMAEAQLVAVVDRRAEMLESFTAEMSGVSSVKTWTDLDSALAESDAEAWIVASTSATHVALTKPILSAGKFVLVEKPISPSLAEARTLAPLVERHSDRLMMGHIVLFSSELRGLRSEISKDGRGRITHVNCCRMRGVDHLQFFPGESPFHVTMVHDLYAVQALLNRPKPRRFWAQQHRNAADAVDLTLAQIEFADGTLASFTAGFMAPEGMGTLAFDRWELFGDGWCARTEPNPRPIEVWDTRSHRPMGTEIHVDETGATAGTGMLAEELRCFCRVVRGVEPIPVGATYADAIQVEEWLDALMKAASAAEK